MSPIERALLVAALVIVVAAVAGLARRPRVRARTLVDVDLEPGVHLLTSEGCASCARARRALEGKAIEFTESSWESEPDLFERLGIDAVPSVIVADAAGNGTWWRGGVSSRLLRQLGLSLDP